VKTITLLILGILLAACGADNSANKTSTDSSAQATKMPDENAALDALRKTNEAQALHFKINRRYALTYEELLESRLLNAAPSTADTGYDFRLRPAADAQTYRVFAAPSGNAPNRHFFMDQTGIIRAETGKEATAESPEIN
jgi:hypothetical protein